MSTKTAKKPKPWTPERIAKFRANPGLRSKLPASLLTAAQRHTREANARANAPIVPGGDTTVAELARQRKTDEALQFGPTLEALAQGKKRIDAQRVRDHGFFTDYKNTVAQAQEQQRLAAADANAAATSTAQTASKDSQKAIDANTNRESLDSAKQGVAFDESAYRDAAQRALAGRSTMGQNQVAEAARGGVAQNSLLGQLAVAAQQGVNRRDVEIDRSESELRDKAQGVRDKRAAWRSNYDAEAKKNAWQRVLEAKAFGLKEKDTLADNKTAADRVAATKRGQDITDANHDADATTKANTPNKYGYLPAEWNAMTTAQRSKIILASKKTSSKGNKPGKATEAENKAWKSTSAAVNWLHQNYGQTVPADPEVEGSTPHYLNLANIHKLRPKVLTDQISLDSPEYIAAVDIFTSGGYISQATADRLHQASIKVRGRYKVMPTAEFRKLVAGRQKTGYK